MPAPKYRRTDGAFIANYPAGIPLHEQPAHDRDAPLEVTAEEVARSVLNEHTPEHARRRILGRAHRSVLAVPACVTLWPDGRASLGFGGDS